MDLEAFSLDTFAGTAACNKEFILASLDIDKAFLKGFTYRELADATGEKTRTVCFKLPPGSAAILRKVKGYEHYDEARHCLRCIKPGTGAKDAPRVFPLKFKKTTNDIGLKSTSYDPELDIKRNLLSAKHVADINMTGTEKDRHIRHQRRISVW